MIEKENGKYRAVCDCCFERSDEYDTYAEMRKGVAFGRYDEDWSEEK